MTTEEEEEIVRQSVKQKSTKDRTILMLLGVLFMIFLIGGGVISALLYVSLKTTAQDGTELAQQIQQACEAPGTPDPDLAQFCPTADDVVDSAPDEVKADPVPGPQGVPGTQGPTGEPGPGPSSEEVMAAVASFCTDTGKCQGPQGDNASARQVAIAVAAYCNNRGMCSGPSGIDGRDGADGQDAEPISPEQIAAAVTTYCNANNQCRGPSGEDGTNGQNGSDGAPGAPGPPGVVNVVDNCEAAPDGQVIADVNSVYDADTQSVIISCTYKDDQTVGLGQGNNP